MLARLALDILEPIVGDAMNQLVAPEPLTGDAPANLRDK